MPSERIQRRIDALLDEADQAVADSNWILVEDRCKNVLRLDPANEDALALLAAAGRGSQEPAPSGPIGAASPATVATSPTSFASGRYAVKKFLGEGGKKRVYLAHDTLLDRDVAFALIKTEGLDDVGRDRITREAQAMGRLGAHPHIVSVFDLGEEPGPHSGPLPILGEGERTTDPLSLAGTPYIVTELMDGGDVEALIQSSPDHRLTLERALDLGMQVCQGLDFAHGKGIVHRDLKPGNVWLTQADLTPGPFPSGEGETTVPSPRGGGLGRGHPGGEGVAKLGDFGLAVAIDRTRLTQAGMMVGTVSYMPPEQATGGEITPRSDLYSLGAMLYEMVTGRPPFVGDEAVAIIGQHLNTPPVAPTWHRPDCPPGLETLILRLLEKEPAKRPASAAEVRAALESVAEHLSSRPPSPRGKEESSSPPPANPLYRRTFVGREQELRKLQGAFDSAISGQGSLAMVAGEPGIGKTSICEQLATYAAIRGGKTLVGHCYEEGSLSLPYLPFVEAMRSYVLAREPEGLKQDLGSGAGEVARVVSEIRDRVGIVEDAAGADAEEQLWRLLQAVTSFLRNASLVQPLLLVLEDLHDADRGTLDLLLHLARNLQGTRLLLVGTYRDVEVDRSHPLSGALAELRRGASFLRIPLRGLTVDEVHRMMTMLRGQEAPWSRAEAIHRQTEGNPLFVQEVLRYLAEEGHLSSSPLPLGEGRGEGRDARSDSSTEAAIPEGLRDVLGKRLSRLSAKTNQVLAVAAVIGREFRLDVLERVLPLPEEELTSALEEASSTAVIETRAGAGPGGIAFRFTHALFRQTLYEELFSLRRIRLHQQVARALEAVYARRLEEHAAELAEHFAQSTEREDMDKALHYSGLAAERATVVYAYGEAVRHLEQSLRVLEVLDPDDQIRRCDLLLALGEMLQAVGDPRRAEREAATEALACATAAGDEARALHACQLAIRALTRFGAAGGARYRSWTEQASARAQPETLERARADLDMSHVLLANRLFRSAWRSRTSARELAGRLGDVDVSYGSAANHSRVCSGPGEPELREVIAELSQASRAGASPRMLNYFVYEAGCSLLGWGELEASGRLFQEAREIAAETRYPSALQRADLIEALSNVLAGNWEDALARAEAFMGQAEGLGNPSWAWAQAASGITRVRLALGRANEALAGLDVAPFPEVEADTRTALRALSLAALGRLDEARVLAGPLLDPEGLGPEADWAPTHLVALLLEVASLVQDRDAMPHLGAQLSSLSDQVIVRFGAVTAAGRLLGAAATLMDEPEAARGYYDQALAACGKIHSRPETALTRLQMAELLLDHYPDERAAAIEHLDFAISEFRDMKMQPSLEGALRRKEVLRA